MAELYIADAFQKIFGDSDSDDGNFEGFIGEDVQENSVK